ncbi:klaroid protein isoform X2 [Anthonomus grandis grandis]|uniref:klaroid protein isoform X2 n=1 Tax=Anthonomus grandis grandis TaxID=2921223 RepID=UPI0021669DC9|nr:klaroid protein isoform X2 [Anthonomus grandis grandis]
MSQMELRSSRSRSRTPFLSQEFIEKEATVTGNHVEKLVTRVTRKSTVVKTDEIASSSTDELNTMRRESPIQTKPTTRKSASRSLRSRVIKTSDYSSEDGENEVSSSRTIRQNEQNQLMEDARRVTNGGTESPALELYKKSGRYWDVYPKTDWTYSYHSKDRCEIAPGVVAMPNMSRKTIHPLDESPSQSFAMYSENVSHKNINTENTYVTSARYSEEATRRSGAYNNNSEDFYIKRRTHTKWGSFKQTISTIVSTIFTTIYTIFFYSFRIQRSIFSYIHHMASRVMLWDTYLLWKAKPGDKTTRLLLLCLLPLLLLGGIHVYLMIGSTLALSCQPNCGKMATEYFHNFIEQIYRTFSFNNTIK